MHKFWFVLPFNPLTYSDGQYVSMHGEPSNGTNKLHPSDHIRSDLMIPELLNPKKKEAKAIGTTEKSSDYYMSKVAILKQFKKY